MNYESRYEKFIFEDYSFDENSGLLTFHYSFDGIITFTEYVRFEPTHTYDRMVFDKAVFLAFVLAGVSYYKSYPTRSVAFATHKISAEQALFFSEVYRDGLSQFIYENSLSPDDIAVFSASHDAVDKPSSYGGSGTLILQSGGKDSLLLATLIGAKAGTLNAWYMSQSANYPAILDSLPGRLHVPVREIDTATLAAVKADGALNGHVPITFINLAYAIVDATLHGYDTVLAAIGREGEEPYDHIGDFAIRHQWSKTWHAETLFSNYIHHVISPDLRVGSPLRGLSELKIAQLFVKNCWNRYGGSFSSCNKANYRQGHDNKILKWCANCPKCANSYLLFAPFLRQEQLEEVFGSNLFVDSSLYGTFKGLLGIDGVVKPFECVGETDELRAAYAMALRQGYDPLPFDVPSVQFDIDAQEDAQLWATQLIAPKLQD